jgi:hypothetical protein
MAIAFEAQAGSSTASVRPSLPAAAVVMMPKSAAVLTATAKGSVSQAAHTAAAPAEAAAAAHAVTSCQSAGTVLDEKEVSVNHGWKHPKHTLSESTATTGVLMGLRCVGGSCSL